MTFTVVMTTFRQFKGLKKWDACLNVSKISPKDSRRLLTTRHRGHRGHPDRMDTVVFCNYSVHVYGLLCGVKQRCRSTRCRWPCEKSMPVCALACLSAGTWTSTQGTHMVFPSWNTSRSGPSHPQPVPPSHTVCIWPGLRTWRPAGQHWLEGCFCRLLPGKWGIFCLPQVGPPISPDTLYRKCGRTSALRAATWTSDWKIISICF